MVYGRYNELVNGVYKPTYNWGAPSCKIHQLSMPFIDKMVHQKNQPASSLGDIHHFRKPWYILKHPIVGQATGHPR